MSNITKIEIIFAIPVEVTDKQQQILDKLVGQICDANEPEGYCFWPAGHGSRPNFSQTDSKFLGKSVDPNAPLTGEPTFDHDVYQIDTCIREAYPDDIERRRGEQVNKKRQQNYKESWFYRFFTQLHDSLEWLEYNLIRKHWLARRVQ